MTEPDPPKLSPLADRLIGVAVVAAGVFALAVLLVPVAALLGLAVRAFRVAAWGG